MSLYRLLIVLFVLSVFAGRLLAAIELRKESWELKADGTIKRVFRLERRCSAKSLESLSSGHHKALWSGASLRLKEAYTKRASGIKIPVNPAAVQYVPCDKGRVDLHFHFPKVTRGDLLVYEVEERQDAGAAGPLGFSPMHIFSSKEKIKKDVFEVVVDHGLKLTWVARRMGKKARPLTTHRGRQRVWRWIMSDLAADGREQLAPTLLKRAPIVRTSLLADWQPVSQWLGGLLRENMRPNAELASLALHLTDGAKGDLEKIGRVHKCLQERLRHVDLDVNTALDLAGHKASQVLKRGYGDCVDRAVLMSSLLGAVGVSSVPVFVCTQGHRSFDPEIATPYCGDHCLVKTEGDFGILFLDPGSAYHRVGELPANVQGVTAYAPTANSMFITPTTTDGDNGIDVTLKGKISEERTVQGTFTLTAHGEDEAKLRRLFANDKIKNKELVLLEFLRLPQGASISNLKMPVSATDLEKRFVISGKYNTDKIGAELGELVLFTPPGHRATAREVAATERKNALCYSTPTRHRIHSSYTYPPQWKALKLPSEEKIEGRGARFFRTVHSQKGLLTIDDRYERQQRTVKTDDYSSFKVLLEKRAALTQQPFVFSRQLQGDFSAKLLLTKSKEKEMNQDKAAEVLLREVQVKINANGTQDILCQEVIAIHQVAGKKAADIVVPIPERGILEEIVAQTHLPSGQIQKVDRRSQKRNSEGLKLSFSSVQKGARLVWRSKVKVQPLLGIPPAGVLSFTSPLPVKKSRFQVIGLRSHKLSAKVTGGNGDALKTTKSSNKRVSSLLLSGPLSGAGKFAFSTIHSWEKLSRSVFSKISLELAKCAKHLLPKIKLTGEPDKRFLQAIGRLNATCAMTGSRPSPLVRAAIIKKALSKKNEECDLFLVAPAKGPFAKEIPSLSQFSDAIIKCGGKWYYPGLPPTAPGAIPQKIAGGKLLRVSSKNGDLAGHLPGRERAERLLDELNVRINVAGDMSVEVERTIEGPLAKKLAKNLSRFSQKENQNKLTQYIRRWYPRAVVRHVKCRENVAPEQMFKMSFDLQLPDSVLKLADGRYIVPFPHLPQNIAGHAVNFSRRCRLQGPMGTQVGTLSKGKLKTGQFRRLMALTPRSLLLEEEGVPCDKEKKYGGISSNGSPLVEFVPKDQL